jgi:hypothetical protein
MSATPVLFEALVDDVLRDVAGWLDYPQDLVNFGLVVSRLYMFEGSVMLKVILAPTYMAFSDSETLRTFRAQGLELVSCPKDSRSSSRLCRTCPVHQATCADRESSL